MTGLLVRMFDDWPLAVVLVSSEDGTITYANPACLRGVTPGQDWVGRHFSELAIQGWDQADWTHTTPVGQVLAGTAPGLHRTSAAGCIWVGSLLPVDGEVLGTEHLADEQDAARQHRLVAMRIVAALELEHSREMNAVARQMLLGSEEHLSRVEEQLVSPSWEPPTPRPVQKLPSRQRR